MNSFEGSLLTQLRHHVAERAAAQPAPKRRLRRWGWAAVPVGAATAVAVSLMLASSPSAYAYAVSKTGNGDVVVTIKKLSDAAGLQRALRADGINAHVNYDADFVPDPPRPTSVSTGSFNQGSGSGPVLQTSGQPPTGSAGAPSGCGPAGPMNVSMGPNSVTFDIPASEVNTATALYITTGGSQSGLNAVQVRWQC